MSASKKRSGLGFLVLLICAIAVPLWFFHTPIFRYLGSLEVSDEPAVKADAIVVLAGDFEGRRILKGAELGLEGFAPVVIADNSGAMYDRREAELAIEFAIRHGYPSSLFVLGDWFATSTADEAVAAVKLLRSRGAHKVLLVTSLWHTARTGRIFRRTAPDMEFHTVGSADPKWHGGDWWLEREGQKTFLLEAEKTLADFLRI